MDHVNYLTDVPTLELVTTIPQRFATTEAVSLPLVPVVPMPWRVTTMQVQASMMARVPFQTSLTTLIMMEMVLEM